MQLMNQQIFSENLLLWWHDNRRHFPWRDTRDLYRVLIAEVLLHRTRADQVVPVYHDFLNRFPDVYALASAHDEEIHKTVRSLGLRWRAQLLKAMAKEIVERYRGRIPVNKNELESLPGVSQYIASAVRCFGLGLTDPILDTNTVRIVGRIFDTDVNDGSRRSKVFKKRYESLMDMDKPRDFNFAMLDLAAILCKPRNPDCNQCPVRAVCKHGMKRLDKDERNIRK